MDPVAILVAGADAGVRARAKAILRGRRDWTVIEAGDGRELIDRVRSERPGLLLLDLGMGLENDPGFLIRLALSESPGTRVLVLSDPGRDTDEDVIGTLEAGARGFIDETELDRLLVKAVEKVTEGEAWVPRKMVVEILRRLVDLAGSAGYVPGAVARG